MLLLLEDALLKHVALALLLRELVLLKLVGRMDRRDLTVLLLLLLLSLLKEDGVLLSLLDLEVELQLPLLFQKVLALNLLLLVKNGLSMVTLLLLLCLKLQYCCFIRYCCCYAISCD